MADADDTPPETLQEYFVVQLRRFRHDRGLSQAQLAERINFSPGLISMVETLQRAPTADFTAACDAALDTGGALANLLPMIAREAYPKWFQSFVTLEGEAVGIEDFEVQLVPGLLQTEEYARAVFELAWPLPDEEEISQMLRARLERQRVLDRKSPPSLWMVLDESILIRRVGTARIMAEQLAHLVEMATRPNLILQILPIDRAGRAPLDGSFVLLQLEHDERIAYTEGLGSGKLLPEPRDVERAARAMNVVRSEALSASESIARIAFLKEKLYDC
jgi:transcriptional regulator with XRE-family HTH domain